MRTGRSKITKRSTKVASPGFHFFTTSSQNWHVLFSETQEPSIAAKDQNCTAIKFVRLRKDSVRDRSEPRTSKTG